MMSLVERLGMGLIAQDVVAILCSDVHFSQRAPVARSAEPDWFLSMRKPWEGIKELQESLGGFPPVVIAGDIFDSWKASSELINFVIDTLPKNTYAIPGQHDLPDHAYSHLDRTPYKTLMLAGAIKNIPSGGVSCVEVEVPSVRKSIGLNLHGFAWNEEIRENAFDKSEDVLDLAVIHEYVWMSEATSYPGASEEHHLGAFRSKIDTYDAAIFGDNHKGFLIHPEGVRCNSILNNGTFYRRKRDEIEYSPQIGILRSDGFIESVELDCSEDVFLEKSLFERTKEMAGESMKDASLGSDLSSLSLDSLDFQSSVESALISKEIKVDPIVSQIVRDILKDSQNAKEITKFRKD